MWTDQRELCVATSFRASIRLMPGVHLVAGRAVGAISVGVRGPTLAAMPAPDVDTELPLLRAGAAWRGSPAPAAGRADYRALAQASTSGDRLRISEMGEREWRAARISALRSVLSGRAREPFDWGARCEPLPALVVEGFDTPEETRIDERSLRREAARRLPYWPWVLSVVAAVAVAFFAPVLPVRALAVFVAAVTALFSLRVPFWRAALRADLRLVRERTERQLVDTARQMHEAEERARREAWAAAQELRRRLREAVEHEDAEPLAVVLAIEMARQDLPVPVVCELSFPTGLTAAEVRLVLPPIADIPGAARREPEPGKDWVGPLPLAERWSVHADLCCGLALRIGAEIFRILPMVERLDLLGTLDPPDNAAGRGRGGFGGGRDGVAAADVAVLHYRASRDDLAGALGGHGVAPEDTLREVGGRFSRDQQGPRPLARAARPAPEPPDGDPPA